MSKKITVAIDGSTYLELPGSMGEFRMDGEPIDDKILGQTFESALTGLINWGITSNGIFKGSVGYKTKIRQQGSTTGMTTEACSLVSGKTYQIDDTAKRIWDRANTLTILDNASPVAASDIESIDYLFGRVTFISSYSVTGPITVTGNYFPTTVVAKANAYTLTMSMAPIDNTDFDTADSNGGYRTFIPGLRTVSLELTGIHDPNNDFKTALAARSEYILEIDPVGDGSSVARGFFRLVNDNQSGEVGALEEESITFALNVPYLSSLAPETPFKWVHTSTTLPQVLQNIIAAWEGELVEDAQYRPQGTISNSPLDAPQGNVVFSDISLSGDLSSMNTFNVTMQGSGAVTLV